MVAVIQVLVIAILISIGYFLAKKQIFTPKTGQQLSYLLINFVTPVLIFNSFQIDYTPDKLREMGLTVLLAIFSYVVVILFSRLYCGKHTVERMAVIFSNVGFMGLPLVSGIYGSAGVLYASLMVITFNVLFWTYGVTLLQGKMDKQGLKKMLLSPTIFGVLLGLLFFLLRLELPDPFHSAAVHLANLNTPLAMLVSGISIAQTDLKAMFKDPKLYKVLVGKLLLAPLVVALAFLLIPVDPMIKEILMIQVACPTAALVGITLLQLGRDNRTAIQYFSMTTLVSMVTIPLVKLLCGFLF